MKYIVLFLVLLVIVLSLAQEFQPQNGRWFHWVSPPQQNDQVYQNREFPQNPWPRVSMQQMILPPTPSNNVGWKQNQGFVNWIPFSFGHYYSPWGVHHFQSGIIPRFPGRPLPVQSNLGMPISLPIQPQFGPSQGPWPIQPQFGPRDQWTSGSWPIPPQIGPYIPPPFYIADRNHFYVK